MKFTKYFSFAVLALAATSCSEDLMDDINKNNGNPEAESVDAKFEFPGIIVNTAFETVSGDYAFYAASYTEQMFGTGSNQLAKAELRNSGETAASSTFNNVWNSTYGSMRACKEAIDKCAEGKVNAGQNDIKGVAEVLMAANLGVLTDMHGDVPYSEALQGQDNLTPKIDSQKDIYTAIFKLLDDAIADLTAAQENDESNIGSQDILFDGDYNQWIGYAYALKARHTLHTQKVDANAITKALEYATKAVNEYGFSGAELAIFDGVTNDNPWTAFFWSREYSASSTTVAALMAERNDPRLGAYTTPLFGTFDTGNPGDALQANNFESLAAPSWLINGTATVNLLSKSEIFFIIAECQARLGQDASSAFATAVGASIVDYAIADANTMGVDTSAIGTYIASLPVTLKEIMVQKYLAQARGEQVEAYNDIRRAKANGEEFIVLTNPNNSNSLGNAWPLRMPYAESDVRSNPNVREAFGSGNDAGRYVFTENIWWAGGSR